MKATQLDRFFVIWIATALVVWCGCVVLLWSIAFDASGESTLVTIIALLLALAASAGLPGRGARAAQTILKWLKVQDDLTMELASVRQDGWGKHEAKAINGILAAAGIFAVAGGLASTVLIFAAVRPVEWLGQAMLWTPQAWTIAQLLIQFVLLVPLAIGVSLVFLVSTLIRGGSGRDVYASTCRDWLWALAGGSAVLGFCWAGGLNLLGLAIMAGFSIIAASAYLFLRSEGAIHPPQSARALADVPTRREWLGVAAGFAAFAIVLWGQGRLLTDVFSADLPVRACWVALSVAILARMLHSVDRKSRPPSALQGIGACILLSATLMLQFALAAGCLSGGVPAIIAGVSAAGAQAPLLAAFAVIISTSRHGFATSGGRARSYLCAAAVGGAAGLLWILAAASVAGGWTSLAGLALAIVAWSIIRGINSSEQMRKQLAWAICGGVLLVTLAGMVLAPLGGFVGGVAVSPGAWLSWSQADDEYLPSQQHWRSKKITGYLEEILSEPTNQGTWWIVAPSRRDLPAKMPSRIVAFTSTTDASAAAGAGDRVDGRLVRGSQISRGRFDGVVLAPLAGDHPYAWRCYNETTLRRCISRTHPGAVMVLRTQVRLENFERALSVAATFQSVAGGGWAVFDVGDDGVDMLLAGPEWIVTPPADQAGLFVFRLEDFTSAHSSAKPIRIVSPGSTGDFADDTPGALRDWLGGLGRREPFAERNVK